MRQPKVETGVSGEFVTRFLDQSKPLPPKAIEGERIADTIDDAAGNLNNPRWIANAPQRKHTSWG